MTGVGYDKSDVQVIDQKAVYQGFFSMQKLHLRHRLHEGGWSPVYTRELFVRGACVGVLLYDPSNQLVGLVEQFRVGALESEQSPWLMEVVAGVVELGESPDTVARRELVEEAGIDNVNLIPICDYLVSPGGSDERMSLWCGLTDLRERSGFFGLETEHEDICLHVLNEQEAFSALAEGRCNNSAAIIGLQWLQLNRERLQEEFCDASV